MAESSRPGKLECFNENQYRILDILGGDDMDKRLAQLSLEDLDNIVTQENKDISCAITMARKNNVDLNAPRVEELDYNCREKTGDILNRICDSDEEVSADIVAKMMYAAEIKSALTAPPQVIYNLLFDDVDYEPLPINTAAYDTSLSDLVVPLAAPACFKTDPDLEDAARMNAHKTLTTQHPDETENGSSDLLQNQLVDRVLEMTHDPDNLGELLMGAQQEVPCDLPATLSDFEFLIEPKESKNQSLYQLRGSVPPYWFPDYFAMFPDSPLKKFEKVEHPMTVLEKAWESVQPADLKPVEGIHLIGL